MDYDLMIVKSGEGPPDATKRVYVRILVTVDAEPDEDGHVYADSVADEVCERVNLPDNMTYEVEKAWSR